MRPIIAIDPASQRAVVEPGVTNLAVSTAARPFGYFYAPDPSSQVVCSVGGNVAENSGGAHCLKHGFTVHHVTGLQIVTPEGELTWIGDGTGAAPGYDLVGVFVGSEGTLGIVTKIMVRLTWIPQSVRRCWPRSRPPGRAGPRCPRSSGRHPSRRHRDDGRARHRGGRGRGGMPLPAGAGAVLVVELDGPRPTCAGTAPQCGRCASRAAAPRSGRPTTRRNGRDLGRAQVRVRRRGPDLPGLPGAGRGGAAHRARRGPGQDRRAGGRGRASGWPTCSTPATGTCTRWSCTTTPRPGQAAAAEEVSGAILDLCIEHGGSITGEHGVGTDKSRYMTKMFSRRRPRHHAAAALRVRPGGLCNPGKIFPTPRLCGEAPGPRRACIPGRLWSGRTVLMRQPGCPPQHASRRPGAWPGPAARSGPAAHRDGDAGMTPHWVAAPDGPGKPAPCSPRRTEHGLAVVPRGSGNRFAGASRRAACDLVIDTLGWTDR